MVRINDQGCVEGEGLDLGLHCVLIRLRVFWVNSSVVGTAWNSVWLGFIGYVAGPHVDYLDSVHSLTSFGFQ